MRSSIEAALSVAPRQSVSPSVRHVPVPLTFFEIGKSYSPEQEQLQEQT